MDKHHSCVKTTGNVAQLWQIEKNLRDNLEIPIEKNWKYSIIDTV